MQHLHVVDLGSYNCDMLRYIRFGMWILDKRYGEEKVSKM